jgi:AraC-like DNA-binding protein
MRKAMLGARSSGTADRPSSGVQPDVVHTFPGPCALYLARLVERWHVTPEDLLAGTGVRREVLYDPRARLSIEQAVELLKRARELTGEPALGVYFGAQLRVSALGTFGTAVLSAATVREAIELSIRFMPIVTTALDLRLRVEGSEASIVVDERADFGGARDVLLLTVLTAIWLIGGKMTGQQITGHADLAMPEPAYLYRLGALGDRIRFKQPLTRVVFDASILALPYRLRDPIALQFAREDCERTLDTLEGPQRTTARVRALFLRGRPLPTVTAVATALHLSPRTLKRRLAAEGTSFSHIVDEELRERAMLLLRSRTLALKDVATSLGYTNVTNFIRAFRRWTGTTPNEHRQSYEPAR